MCGEKDFLEEEKGGGESPKGIWRVAFGRG